MHCFFILIVSVIGMVFEYIEVECLDNVMWCYLVLLSIALCKCYAVVCS